MQLIIYYHALTSLMLLLVTALPGPIDRSDPQHPINYRFKQKQQWNRRTIHMLGGKAPAFDRPNLGPMWIPRDYLFDREISWEQRQDIKRQYFSEIEEMLLRVAKGGRALTSAEQTALRNELWDKFDPLIDEEERKYLRSNDDEYDKPIPKSATRREVQRKLQSKEKELEKAVKEGCQATTAVEAARRRVVEAVANESRCKVEVTRIRAQVAQLKSLLDEKTAKEEEEKKRRTKDVDSSSSSNPNELAFQKMSLLPQANSLMRSTAQSLQRMDPSAVLRGIPGHAAAIVASGRSSLAQIPRQAMGGSTRMGIRVL